MDQANQKPIGGLLQSQGGFFYTFFKWSLYLFTTFLCVCDPILIVDLFVQQATENPSVNQFNQTERDICSMTKSNSVRPKFKKINSKTCIFIFKKKNPFFSLYILNRESCVNRLPPPCGSDLFRRKISRDLLRIFSPFLRAGPGRVRCADRVSGLSGAF